MNSSTSISSSTEYNLSNETNRVSVYVLPVIIALIVTTNTINISVLCRRPLRSSACTHYFLALAISTLVYLPFTPVNMFLSNQFHISINFSPLGCKINFFFIYASALFFSATLVCASIDRYFTSSSSLHLRNLSSPRMARRIILIISLLIAIYMCPLILISYWDYTSQRCVQYSTTLIVIYLSSRVVLQYIMGPLTMTVFGILTVRNIRNHRSRIAPLDGQRRHRRTEGQLSRMLIIQVGTYLLFSSPVAVTYILVTFIPSTNTSLVAGIRTISIIWQQGTFFLSFFFYILSASVYRQELKKMSNLDCLQGRVNRHVTHLATRLPASHIVTTRV